MGSRRDSIQSIKPAGAATQPKVFHSQTAQDQSRQHIGDVVFQTIVFLGGDSNTEIPSTIREYLLSLVTDQSPVIKVCLESLSFNDMDTRRRSIAPKFDGTCDWLPQHPQYRAWKDGEKSLLFLKGLPGSGKSTLMKYLDSSKAEKSAGSHVVASFFFSGSGAALQRNALGLFRSLLYRLLPKFPGLFDEFHAILKKKRQKTKDNAGEDCECQKTKDNTGEDCECQKTKDNAGEDWEWRVDELQQFFKSHIVSKGRRVRIFIDALDECVAEDASQLLEYFQDVCKTVGSALSICISCRQLPGPIDHALMIHVEDENKEGISAYVGKTLRSCFSPAAQKTAANKTVAQLIDEVLTKASGIFQLAVLAVAKILAWKKEGNGPRMILNLFQKAARTVNDNYREALDKRRDNPNALQLMRWVCLANRPLSLTELRFAMASGSYDTFQREKSFEREDDMDEKPRFHRDLDESPLYETEEQMKDLLKYLFPDLVEVKYEGRENKVQLIHQSCRDFVIQEGLGILHGKHGGNVIAEGHNYLARSCINYVTLEDVPMIAKSGQIQELPFLNYAATSWLRHAKEAEESGIPQDDLLKRFEWPSNTVFRRWVDEYQVINKWSDDCPHLEACLLHIAAEHGLLSLVKSIIDGKHPYLEAVDEDGRAPLAYAAQRGQEKVVQALVQKGAKADSKDSKGRTALWYAIRFGHEPVLRVLLKERDDADIRADNIQKSLWFAARLGHTSVVRLLLKNGFDPNFLDGDKRTLLWHAAANGRTELVQLLLQRKAAPDGKDRFDRTPLSLAADNGHEKVVEILLKEGANVNSRDTNSRSPLSLAADNGHVAVVRVLLANAADVDALDKESRAPLWYSAMRGHSQVVELLLEHNADVNKKDNEGWSPLFWAAGYGHVEVVKKLLSEKAIDISLRDTKDRTALSFAKDNNYGEVVELLTAHGVSD